MSAGTIINEHSCFTSTTGINNPTTDMRIYFFLFGIIVSEQRLDLCDDGRCQLPENAYCPGNQWFTNPPPPIFQSRIVGGEAAIRSSWPWIVSLSDTESSSDKWCGGQIVTDEWILTAGERIDIH